MERFADSAGGPEVATTTRSPRPSLATCTRDYSIPGVDPRESNPYRWHSGEKRDHGGRGRDRVIDVVKQFGAPGS